MGFLGPIDMIRIAVIVASLVLGLIQNSTFWLMGPLELCSKMSRPQSRMGTVPESHCF